MDKVKVEGRINQQENDLLNSIPDIVDIPPLLADL